MLQQNLVKLCEKYDVVLQYDEVFRRLSQIGDLTRCPQR
jgi:adenosylmethionine-8-amino-7-oxononanoate aminotransferase